MNRSLTKVILLSFLVALASGCSWSKKDKEPKQKALTDYQASKEINALEIPPDLSSESSEKTLSVPKYTQKTTTTPPGQQTGTQAGDVYETKPDTFVSTDPAAVLTETKEVPKMYIERAGSQRWLVVQQAYSITYSDVRDFILAVGLALESEDKDTGLLETTWADNWANNVLTGMQKWLQKGLGSIYTSATRDKYRFRVEPGRVEGTSEVYVTHKGMIQKAIIDNSYDPQRTIWEPIPPDPEIEAEMLARLMVDLGASEVKASENLAAAEKAPDRASIVQSANGQPELIVNDGVDIAWRRVGQTLDRVGFSLEDRDEVKRVYVVRYADPDFSNKKPGFFSKMFNKNKAVDEGIYQILLTGQGDKTTVNVTAKDGTPAPKKVTTQIINLLYEQLR